VDPRRRDVRYPYALPLLVKHGRAKAKLMTVDVSFSGLFVAGSARLQLRQLVMLDAELPQGGPFATHAMVVYARPAGRDSVEGFGLKFYGLAREDLARWSRFVEYVRDLGRANQPGTVPRDRRRHERAAVVLKVRPQGTDALLDLYATDLSLGGMYVETDQMLRVGSALSSEIVHPDTGEIFELECVVRRCQGGPQPGLGVEFVNLDETIKQQLQAFVSNAIPVVIVDAE
jgi:hypothetical protein